jgi:hypothetical protein
MKTLFRSQRMLLLVAGLILTTTTLLLFSAVSSALVVQVEDDLQAYWRTTYDILVRPSGSQSSLERQHGLVEANYLSQIEGGISWEQYQTIANLPDIEVVAPVALLTYISDRLSDDVTLPQPKDDGVYLQETIMVTDGIGWKPMIDHRYATFHYRGADAANQSGSRDIAVNQPVVPMGNSVRLLLAAVDPTTEADLIGLDQAIREGHYLTGAEAVYTNTMTTPRGTIVLYNDIPLLLNATPYTSLTLQHRLAQVQLPPDVTSLADIMERGGVDYLDSLPATTIVEQESSIRDAYPQFIDNLWQPRRTGSTVQAYSLNEKSEQPLSRHYRPMASPFPDQELVLEFLPRSLPAQEALASHERQFTLKAYGVFDIEQIPPPPDVNRVPLEIYYPPVVLLRYDEQGQPVTPPRPMQPLPGPTSYVLAPPLMLTTMEIAQAISGGCADCINAIRVRVAGIDELTPAAQRKIEAIAGDIAHQTGLDVDIMVGSSPTRLLVLIPGLGYVEEQWIQKNVTTSYQEQVQVGHWLLLATLLGIGGLFVLDLAWADVVARRRIIALQKALGWRSSSVFAQVLGQILLAAMVAAVLSLPLATALIWLLDWMLPSVAWLVGVPLLVVLLSLLGGLYPAWLAARVPPIIGLQQGHSHHTTGSRSSAFSPLPSALFLLAWRGLTRRWHHSLLGALTAALSAALLVLLLSVTMNQQGALSGTLLGEFILVRIEGYHYALVAIGFALAAFSLANSLLAGVLERRREIGVLKATGWRTETVTRLFLTEGSLLGLLGGLLGVLLGLITFAAIYQALSLNLLWIGAVGLLTPVLVGALAALYPARVAAHVPPAEAVRYE